MTTVSKRRIFLNKGSDLYQIFSFSQHNDGSIYCASPDFADAKWLSCDIGPQAISVRATENVGDGKISLHGTGMVTVRGHADPGGHQLVVKGNFLKKDQQLGVRHLFTVFPKEPRYQPIGSPAFNRESDYAMNATEELGPFVLVFFAVPLMASEIDFRFSLHGDQMVNVPNDFLGMHSFTLRFHHVMWFAYRTRHLDRWPKYSHYCYSDGHRFPIFIGGENNVLTLELRNPQYVLSGNKLLVDCGVPAAT